MAGQTAVGLAAVIVLSACSAATEPSGLTQSADYCAMADATLSPQAMMACSDVLSRVSTGLIEARQTGQSAAPFVVVFSKLRPVSPYGPTNQGLKGLSPGWSSSRAAEAERAGASGNLEAISNSADGAFAALQQMDMAGQFTRTSPFDVLKAHTGEHATADTIDLLWRYSTQHGITIDEMAILTYAALGATGHGPRAP